MVTSPSADPLEPSRHEGITQKITPLTAGKKYILSFFSRVQNFTNNNHYLEEFNIKLMNCNDVSNITQPAFPRSFNIPNFDAYPHQNLICQTSNINTTWQQYTITFMASANFDAIVMYPRNIIVSPFSNFIGVLLAYPQLFEVSNFTAGPIPNPTPGNCTVTIGPTTPNCSVANALYTWTSPNGTSFPANALQQIQVDAGIQQNVGIWKLSMTVPNAITPNGGCSQPPVVGATVNVPACQNCTPPTIAANGPLDQCIQYESGFLTFSTNLTSNIQWYNNGNPIPGATSTTYTENNNPGPNWPTSTGTYYVKNTVTNCISNILSVVRRNYSTPNVYPGSNQTTLHYCKNSVGVLHQENSITDPNTTIFSWEIRDPFGTDVTGVSVILGANNSTTYHTTISFLNYPYTTATIICKTTDNGCTNTASPYQVTIHPDPCNFLVKPDVEEPLIPNNIQLYPNPASNQVTITCQKGSISYIEISDLMNPTLKRIKVNNTKSVTVNVSDLKPGIYNWRITTAKGTENQKLIIKK